MSDLMFTLASALAMFIVIAFSCYMVSSTKGRISEGFKIMLLGHIPLMILNLAHALSILMVGTPQVSEIKLEFLEQTAQVIAAFSIFIAIYLIRTMVFNKVVQS